MWLTSMEGRRNEAQMERPDSAPADARRVFPRRDRPARLLRPIQPGCFQFAVPCRRRRVLRLRRIRTAHNTATTSGGQP